MTDKKKKEQEYLGFEQGPIRPPSEARSLLIRVTRNCPWNRCTFCPVYKGTKFSLRPKEHVLKDIDTVAGFVDMIRNRLNATGQITQKELRKLMENVDEEDMPAFHAAVTFAYAGFESVFLQDANSLIMPPEDLIEVLQHIRKHFPEVKRITSYARSHTIARISDEHLEQMAEAGLNRIHIGLESGSDAVLERVKKGVDKKTHIKAGRKVKNAGMELSEYVMPGLGGKELSREHAIQTADALNQINPDFIRIRTLAIPGNIPLFDEWQTGTFEKPTDIETVEELLLFIEHLEGITSQVVSDHILNLFEELNGKLPFAKEKMIRVLRDFLGLPKEHQCLYQVGRRLGVFRGLNDMKDPALLGKSEAACKNLGITPDNADQVISDLMTRFI